mmetsp:Transcript_13378/g.13297  ORF Transcript_13378/g.13297 Transcript_13378/m.13297 type:complete len:816 (+) Transcript_13378:272-2719(+)
MITLLIEKNFYMVSLEDLSTVQNIKTKEIKSNVYMYAIQKTNDLLRSIDPVNIRLSIATNKYIHFWALNREFRFEEEKDPETAEARKFHFGDKAYALEWIENKMVIGTKTSYFVVDSESGVTTDIKVNCPTKEPSVGVVNDFKFVLIGKGNKICSYNDNTGKISWFCDDMAGQKFIIQPHNLNLFLCSDREIRVYNPENNLTVQEFGEINDPNAQYTALGYKKHEVIVAYNPNPGNRKQSKTIIKIFKEAAIEEQIMRFLKQGEDTEAERIFYIGYKGKPNLDQLKNEFELNRGWIQFFHRLEFESATYSLINGKIDPRELMIVFGYDQHCRALADIISKQPKDSAENYIEDYIKKINSSLDTKYTLNKAKESLLNVLNNVYWALGKETVDRRIMFSGCPYSEVSNLIKPEYKEVRISDILPILKTVIIFVLSDIGFNMELEKAFTKRDAFFEDEVKLYLTRMKQKEPLAIYFEGTGDITNALKTWQEIGDDRAIIKTISIIKNTNLSRDNLFRYCRWIIREKPDQVIQIMLQYEKTSLSPELVIDFLRDCDSEESLVLKYLRSFISERKDTSQSLHNTLAFEYIRQIYELKNPSRGYEEKCSDEESLALSRENFRTFLNESEHYNAQIVLNKIKTSWMMEEIILLLVKAGKHSEALETYLDKDMDKEAEEFCEAMDEKLNLITTLFEIYIKRFIYWDEKLGIIKTQELSSIEYGKANAHKQRYEASVMSILQKYACNSSLDAIRVIQAFPDNWDLTRGNNYDVMKYLKTVLDYKLTMQENNEIGEGLSKVEYINLDYKVAQKKRAYVKITSDYI